MRVPSLFVNKDDEHSDGNSLRYSDTSGVIVDNESSSVPPPNGHAALSKSSSREILPQTPSKASKNSHDINKLSKKHSEDDINDGSGTQSSSVPQITIQEADDDNGLDPLSTMILKAASHQTFKSFGENGISENDSALSVADGPKSSHSKEGISPTKVSPSSMYLTGNDDTQKIHQISSVNTNHSTGTTIINSEHFSPKQPKPSQTRISVFSKLFKSSGRPTKQDEMSPASSLDPSREEGFNAAVLWYVPNTPIQPKYIRVRAHKKTSRDYLRMFLAQELNVSKQEASRDALAISRASLLADDQSSYNDTAEDIKSPSSSGNTGKKAVWALEFSRNGKYLAVAGEDCIIRVWEVLSEAFERLSLDDKDDSSSDSETERGRLRHRSRRRRKARRAYAPVFKSKPIREYDGHVSDVLALSWSKNNFLLSSSMDKTVRLWHVDRPKCLGSFMHPDFVTSIKFHPKDDRFFLSGSVDCKLRLWSIPDEEIAFSKNAGDLVTAVEFDEDGQTAIAGCFGGHCLFYETDGLKLVDRIHVRSTRGRNSKGSKITGIQTIRLKSDYSNGFDNDVKLLISTNDSRIRIYNWHDKTLNLKLKGHVNEQGQIQASFSDDGQYVISGSEDERTYIWKIGGRDLRASGKELQEYEYFHLNKAQVTCTVFAPISTKKILAGSGDPIYDICEPPPIILKPSSEEPGIPPIKSSQSSHPRGNIIVTADKMGFVKVFRQDCAFGNRKSYAEAGSFIQKKRLSGISSLGLSPEHSMRDKSRSNNSPLRSTMSQVQTFSDDGSTKGNGGSQPRDISASSVMSNKSDLLTCKKCKGLDFKAVRKTDGTTGLICSNCGVELNDKRGDSEKEKKEKKRDSGGER